MITRLPLGAPTCGAHLSGIVIAILVVWAASPNAAAASGTWSGAGSDSLWSDTSNWSSGTVAGSNDGATATDSSVATFGTTSAGGNGTIISPVVIDSGRNVEDISFTSGATTAGFVIGSTSGNKLTLTSGSSASIIMGYGDMNSQTINAPLVIGASGIAAVYAFQNLSTTNSSGLNIGGTITGGGGTGSLTLSLEGGAGAGAGLFGGGNYNTISGIISNGGVSDPTSIIVSGSSNQGGGTFWRLSGNNTYSGGTTINSGYLVIGNNNALGTGALKVAAGGFETDGGNYTIPNALAWTNTSGNYAGFIGTGNLTVNGATSFAGGSGAGASSQTYYNSGSGTLTLAGGVNLSTAGAGTATNDYLAGAGAWVVSAGTAISDNGQAGTGLTYFGPGTLDIQGHASSTGAWSFLGGTVILDDSSDTANKIGSGTLTLGGVNLQLFGGYWHSDEFCNCLRRRRHGQYQ